MRKTEFRYFYLLFLFLFIIHAVGAQEQTVQGQVTDGESNTSLPGVNIVIKGTTKGTVTDLDGNYSLQVPSDATLVFTYVGYEPLEIKVGSRSVIDISLEPETGILEEVVVVAYGQVKKRELTGSVSSISGEDISRVAPISFDQALQGRAAGVQVTQVSGQPGGGTSVRIRGSSSISAGNEPLYVIDGVIINSNTSDVNAGGSAGQLNPLSVINPNDIESIEVLKDASATALYGARAANGVVLVTTKRGKEGQASITFDSYYGVQEVYNTLDLLNGEEFATYINALREERNLPADPRFLVPEDFGVGTDWQEAIFREAPMQSHLLTMSGGDEKTQYSVSGSYFKQEGIIINSDFERGTFRANLDRKIGDRLNIGTRINLSRIVSRGVLTGAQSPGTGVLLPGSVSSAVLFPPTLPVLDENGPGGYTFDDGLGRNLPNPVADALETDNISKNTRAIASLFGEIELIEDLIFKINLGLDAFSVKENRFVPNFLKRTEPNNGEASIATIDGQTWLTEFTFNYQKQINSEHRIEALLGHTRQGFSSERLFAFSLDFEDNRIGFHDLSAGLNPQPPSSSELEWAFISYLGRVNYKFKDRYILTANARVDGSSRFGTNEKYGFFPSVAVAWDITREDFMEGVGSFELLKLRASYGVIGNAEIGSFASLATVGPRGEGTFTNDEAFIGVEPLRLANPDLKWERTQQFDLGIDLAFFDARLTVTADYYLQNTTDLLLNTPIPTTSGFASFFNNIGELRNEGVELAIDGIVLETNSFNWNASFNISSNRNEVKALSGGNDILSPGVLVVPSGWGIIRVGEPLGSFFGLVEAGIFQTDAEAQSSPLLIGQAGEAGERRYLDLNGTDAEGNLTGQPDGVINEADRVVIGRAQPKFTWNLSNNFNYRSFDLSVFIQASHGNDVLNAYRFELENLNGETNVFRDAFVNRWTPENPSNEFRKLDPSDQNTFSTAQVDDGSFVRIRTVNLGYSLPPDLLEKLRLSKLRTYVTVNNLYTFTDYIGYDPEVNAFGQNQAFLGVDYGGYPLARTYIVGIQIGI